MIRGRPERSGFSSTRRVEAGRRLPGGDGPGPIVRRLLPAVALSSSVAASGCEVLIGGALVVFLIVALGFVLGIVIAVVVAVPVGIHQHRKLDRQIAEALSVSPDGTVFYEMPHRKRRRPGKYEDGVFTARAKTRSRFDLPEAITGNWCDAVDYLHPPANACARCDLRRAMRVVENRRQSKAKSK